MKKKIILFSSIGGALLIGLTILIICLCLSGSKSYRTIKVYSISGSVNVKREENTLTATKDMKLKNNDEVNVLENSSTVLKLDSDKFIMVKENTTLKLEATGKKKNTKTRIHVLDGGVVVEVKNKLKDSETFEIASSNSVMAIRGTQISFSVAVKDNKVTTSVAVLEGNTEILLFKDEKLSKTTLPKDFKLSYTTDLDAVSDDISKILDSGIIEDVTDEALETVFNVVKEHLTSEEIDDIVDVINTFDRDELVNGVIKFSFNKEVIYGTDPKTCIEIEEAYKTLVGLTYKYSQDPNGEYVLFDSSNPLDYGEWYCKITAGNAYRSDPIKFEILSAGLNFKFDSNPEYGNNPSNVITIRNASEYQNIKYLYSQTIDGTYTEFKASNPLSVGEWYCKITYNNNEETRPIKFNVLSKAISSPINLAPLYHDGNAYLEANLDELKEFFDSDLGHTHIGDDEPNADHPYKYYVYVSYGNPDENKEGWDGFYLDCTTIQTVGSSHFTNLPNMGISIEYKLPEQFTITSETSYEIDLENTFDVKYIYVSNGVDDNTEIHAFIDYYGINEDEITFIYTEGGEEYSYEASVLNGRCDLSVNIGTQCSFYFEFGETRLKSKTYSFNADNFATQMTTNVESSGGTPENTIVTYNNDQTETINMYYNIAFNGDDTFDHLVILDYNIDDAEISSSVISTSNKEYAVFEDVRDTTYVIDFIGYTYTTDGLAYLYGMSDTPSGGLNDNNASYAFMGYDGETSNYYVESYQLFVKDHDVKVYDLDNRVIATITEEDFTNDYAFIMMLDGYDNTDCYVSGYVYSHISAEVANSLQTANGGMNEEAFDYVKDTLSDAGITIKGDNYYYRRNISAILG